MKKNCVICSAGFSCIGTNITCSSECRRLRRNLTNRRVADERKRTPEQLKRRGEYMKGYWKRESYREARKRYYLKPEGRFTKYKSSAKMDGKEFTLTIEDFREFWQRPCHYCGQSIDTLGIDRVDSSMGYTKENTVSCCYRCNSMKMDLTTKQFLEHIMKIAKHADYEKYLREEE